MTCITIQFSSHTHTVSFSDIQGASTLETHVCSYSGTACSNRNEPTIATHNTQHHGWRRMCSERSQTGKNYSICFHAKVQKSSEPGETSLWC